MNDVYEIPESHEAESKIVAAGESEEMHTSSVVNLLE